MTANISIHALLAESDSKIPPPDSRSPTFLSTLSLRRATFRVTVPQHVVVISIHALLAESDVATVGLNLVGQIFLSTLSLRRATTSHGRPGEFQRYFYPRSPCGERPLQNRAIIANRHFYPRSPCGERLTSVLPTIPAPTISIHALLAESDLRRSASIWLDRYFYPRSPCGERRRCFSVSQSRLEFLSTLSLRRATVYCRQRSAKTAYFYPRSPCGERPLIRYQL